MRWAAQRARDQHEIVARLYERGREVPCERAAVLAAGLPGAVKDEALARAGVDPARYLSVSIDMVLAELAAAQLIPDVDGLAPLEGADLAHHEAQYLAKRVGLLALTDGRNLILDITLASPLSAESWMYAVRFAGYGVTAVFADIDVEESVRRADAAHRQGQEEYRQGRGHGGRYIPAEAIRALTAPAVAGARSRISWASGMPPVDLEEPATGGAFAGGAVTLMIDSYRNGRLTLEGLGLEFRARRWPAVPAVCPPAMAPASAAIDDPEPYVPGSFDDVVLAYDLGRLSDEEFEFLAEAAA